MTIMWSILSTLFVLALWGMQSFLAQRSITFTAWQWTAYTAWLLWTLLGVALVRTFIDEREPRPVRVSMLVFGGVSVIAAAILTRLWFFV
ncbi:MAG: hypothetical protein GY832_17275 [Chloroflexi bacterium]|nr:hypothetical protein [Chloroflexota bacterium]